MGAQQILDYLNEKTGREGNRKLKGKGTLAPIKARLNEGFTPADCKAVIDYRVEEWTGGKWTGHNGKPSDYYLRPSTLFKSGDRSTPFGEVVSEAHDFLSKKRKQEEAARVRKHGDRRLENEAEALQRTRDLRALVKWHNDGRPRSRMGVDMPEETYLGMCEKADELVATGVIK